MGGDQPHTHTLTGTVTKVKRSLTESKEPGEGVFIEPYGEVEVELGPAHNPVRVTVPVPWGVAERIRPGQRVTITFAGFDPDSEEAERRADAGYHNR